MNDQITGLMRAYIYEKLPSDFPTVNLAQRVVQNEHIEQSRRWLRHDTISGDLHARKTRMNHQW